jgi:hypothetical protein
LVSLVLASLLPFFSISAAACEHAVDRVAAPADSGGGVMLAPSGPIVIPRLSSAPMLEEFLVPGTISGAARNMLRVDRFVERYPRDGGRPSERTAAYLGYTHDAFFAAFICHDSTPKLIRAHMLQRDGLEDDDNVQLMLDTFDDHRHAFSFSSNALGVQSDALYSEQDGYDSSFDTVWDTWGRRTRFGYVVLFRIPFASLYFAKAVPGELRTWGIILGRNISHTNESDYWPRIRHDVAGRLTQDVAVEGFADIERGRNIQLEPYSLGRNFRQLNTVNPVNPYFEDRHLQGYAGMDAKIILHNSLVLDATLNPDFSQVGIDNPASPNQRFPPYFPEVRPFFIENSSYFDTPINLYYTNNIVSPEMGARLTGKVGPWALGLLAVDDRSPAQALAAASPQAGTRAHFYIARVDRDIGSLSDLGLIYADREYADSYNRSGGIDYRARVRNRWTFTGQALTSQTDNVSNDTAGEQDCENYSLYCGGQAWYQQASYSSLHDSGWIAYSDTAAGFVTDTGFFTRPDVREVNGAYQHDFRPQNSFILEDGPHIYSERIWDHHGVPLDYYFNPSWNFDFAGRTSLSANVSLGQDRLRPIDYPALTHDVEYPDTSAGFNFYTSPLPWLALGAGYYQGSTINYSPPNGAGPGPVNVASPNVNLNVKPFPDVYLQNSYVYTHFTTPTANGNVYDNHELISRWNYQFTKAASINLIGQYISYLPNQQYTDQSNSKNLFADALFTYMPHPGTAFYFGYIGNFANIDRALCTRQSDGLCNAAEPILPPTYSSLMNDGKNLYMKASYLLRF